MTEKVYFKHNSDEWGTPLALFRKLMDEITYCVDVFADKENALLEQYIGKDGNIEDAFGESSWKDACKISHSATRYYKHSFFVNPPYSMIDKAIERVYSEYTKDMSTRYAVLVPSRTDTRWFHQIILHSLYQNQGSIEFIKGRLKFRDFENNSANSAPFPSMIWYLGTNSVYKIGSRIQ